MKRAGIGYKELADRLNRHGLQETEPSITGKLARGTFAATFFLACLAVLELESVRAWPRIVIVVVDVFKHLFLVHRVEQGGVPGVGSKRDKAMPRYW